MASHRGQLKRKYLSLKASTIHDTGLNNPVLFDLVPKRKEGAGCTIDQEEGESSGELPHELLVVRV